MPRNRMAPTVGPVLRMLVELLPPVSADLRCGSAPLSYRVLESAVLAAQCDLSRWNRPRISNCRSLPGRDTSQTAASYCSLDQLSRPKPMPRGRLHVATRLTRGSFARNSLTVTESRVQLFFETVNGSSHVKRVRPKEYFQLAGGGAEKHDRGLFIAEDGLFVVI